LLKQSDGESSANIQARLKRQDNGNWRDNQNPRAAFRHRNRYLVCSRCAGEALLRQAITRLNLSARAYHRVLKVRAPSPTWQATKAY